MKLGFIGFGEAAFEMSTGLLEEGLRGIVAFDPLWNDPVAGSLIKERAEKASVEVITSLKEIAEISTVLIVAVPADKAYPVSQSIVPYLVGNSLYVDVSASTPETKTKIQKEIESNGIEFVDAAMMGPLSVYKHQVPILASGKGTDRFIQSMSKYNMSISKISEIAGDASATKLVRSIFMKGIASLLVEMLTAANHFNVEEQVVASINETMNKSDFEQTMNRLITGTAIHSERRSTELMGSIEMLDEAKLSSLMSKATKETLDKITQRNLKEAFKGIKPESWKDVIDKL